MSGIFGIIAVPFGYIMRLMYDFIGNYGLCIILFSLLVKLITSPLTLKQKRSMMVTQRLQPKIQAVQKKYMNDKTKMNEELSALYDREGASPTAGCGTSIITLVIMLGLYYVISQPLTYFMGLSADEVSRVATTLGVEVGKGYGGQMSIMGLISQQSNFELVRGISDKIMMVDFTFLGVDLSTVPSIKDFSLLWLIPVLSGLTAFGMSFLQTRIQQKTSAADNPAAAKTNTMMLVLMPLMSVYFGFILPAGLGLYWISNNIFGAISEPILTFIMKKDKEKA